MRATTILPLLLAVFVTCTAAHAGQPAAMAQISQADVDAYIYLLSNINTVADDPNAIFQLYRTSGLSPDRYQLIEGKVMASYYLSLGATPEALRNQGMPPEMLPSPAEAQVINANMDAIMKAMMGSVNSGQ